MAIIHVLDKNTIDQIAAGEVVERPANVVKELVENSIDSGATAVTVEIRGGGIELIRVTDNGCGIEKSQLRNAFMRHATSKITNASDLIAIHSLGFRGEALSSISSVAQVDLITKTRDDLTGTRYSINGGEEAGIEEIGAPDGTSIIVRNLFYNTPARKKFLKTEHTEGSYVEELVEHLAMDNPTVSFHLIINKNDKFSTSGNGDLKEIIYKIFGRDVALNVVPFRIEKDELTIEGYLGKPVLNRSNRNFEMFYVNGRYIRDKILSKAVEEGYKQYLMMHKFPFCVLHVHMAPDMVDVNVHPSKMEVRFANSQELFDKIADGIKSFLHNLEMIPDAVLDEKLTSEDHSTLNVATEPALDNHAPIAKASLPKAARSAEPFETKRFEEQKVAESAPVFAEGIAPKPVEIRDTNKSSIWNKVFDGKKSPKTSDPLTSNASNEPKTLGNTGINDHGSPIIKSEHSIVVEKATQLNMFDEKMLIEENRKDYKIIGQVFDTYWIISFKDKMYYVDQHAAHEKVNYERMIKRYNDNDLASQIVNPPVIISLSPAEEDIFLKYRGYFEKLGFNIENFGGHEYAMRAIPIDLFGCSNEKQMFIEILDDLTSESYEEKTPDVINYKIASMACKASVKGNMKMSVMEMEALIDELLTLDNPYNCPHGRPTMIAMSKYELDKKFKRVVD